MSYGPRDPRQRKTYQPLPLSSSSSALASASASASTSANPNQSQGMRSNSDSMPSPSHLPQPSSRSFSYSASSTSGFEPGTGEINSRKRVALDQNDSNRPQKALAASPGASGSASGNGYGNGYGYAYGYGYGSGNVGGGPNPPTPASNGLPWSSTATSLIRDPSQLIGPSGSGAGASDRSDTSDPINPHNRANEPDMERAKGKAKAKGKERGELEASNEKRGKDRSEKDQINMALEQHIDFIFEMWGKAEEYLSIQRKVQIHQANVKENRSYQDDVETQSRINELQTRLEKVGKEYKAAKKKARNPLAWVFSKHSQIKGDPPKEREGSISSNRGGVGSASGSGNGNGNLNRSSPVDPSPMVQSPLTTAFTHPSIPNSNSLEGKIMQLESKFGEIERKLDQVVINHSSVPSEVTPHIGARGPEIDENEDQSPMEDLRVEFDSFREELTAQISEHFDQFPDLVREELGKIREGIKVRRHQKTIGEVGGGGGSSPLSSPALQRVESESRHSSVQPSESRISLVQPGKKTVESTPGVSNQNQISSINLAQIESQALENRKLIEEKCSENQKLIQDQSSETKKQISDQSSEIQKLHESLSAFSSKFSSLEESHELLRKEYQSLSSKVSELEAELKVSKKKSEDRIKKLEVEIISLTNEANQTNVKIQNLYKQVQDEVSIGNQRNVTNLKNDRQFVEDLSALKENINGCTKRLNELNKDDEIVGIQAVITEQNARIGALNQKVYEMRNRWAGLMRLLSKQGEEDELIENGQILEIQGKEVQNQQQQQQQQAQGAQAAQQRVQSPQAQQVQSPQFQQQSRIAHPKNLVRPSPSSPFPSRQPSPSSLPSPLLPVPPTSDRQRSSSSNPPNQSRHQQILQQQQQILQQQQYIMQQRQLPNPLNSANANSSSINETPSPTALTGAENMNVGGRGNQLSGSGSGSESGNGSGNGSGCGNGNGKMIVPLARFKDAAEHLSQGFQQGGHTVPPAKCLKAIQKSGGNLPQAVAFVRAQYSIPVPPNPLPPGHNYASNEASQAVPSPPRASPLPSPTPRTQSQQNH